MLKRIEIENFRGIKSLQADVEAVTAFLGPNSSGKTTVLHAVRVAIHGLSLALEGGRAARVVQRSGNAWIEIRPDVVNPADLATLADWQALFTNQQSARRDAITLRLSFESTDAIQALEVVIAVVSNAQLTLAASVLAPSAIQAVQGLSPSWGQINRTLRPWLLSHAPVAVFVPPFYGVVLNEELRARPVVDKLLGSSDQSHVVRNLVASIEPELFERLNNFLAEAIGARLTYRTSGDALQRENPLRVTFSDSDGDIEISAAGAGLINLVALFAALSRWRQEAGQRPVVFLLDEPEAHLHPRLQAETTARLGRLATADFGAQLLLATHSVDILNRLSEEGARLIRCDRLAQPSAVALASDASLFDDIAEWADLTPYTAINFLAARRVLFVEGVDEVQLIPRLGELRFRNDVARLRQFRRWAIVPLQGASNAPIAALLARLVASDVVRAQAQSGGFRVVVALDRDYQRTPGTETETVDGVVKTTVVWSQHSLESLLVSRRVLPYWIRALLKEQAPEDVDDRINAALAAADQDVDLNRSAIAHLVAARLEAAIRSGAALLADQGRVMKDTTTEAAQLVQHEPATWQRGKDRAAFVLRYLRDRLDPAAQGHFPTDICRLIQTVPINSFGDSIAPIPHELGALLESLALP